jgi:hypothetical protein
MGGGPDPQESWQYMRRLRRKCDCTDRLSGQRIGSSAFARKMQARWIIDKIDNIG